MLSHSHDNTAGLGWGGCKENEANSARGCQMKYIHLTLNSVNSVVQQNGQTSSQTLGISLFTHVQEWSTLTGTGTQNCYEVNEKPVFWEETEKRLLI